MPINDKDEYSKAFNSEDDNIPTDDAAEGTGDAEGSAVMLTGGQPEEAEVSAESAPEKAPEVQAEAPTEAEAVAETANPEMTPEDEQRAKSWEGRLKAMEKALKQKESELAAREAALGQPGSMQALADGGEVMGGGINNGAESAPQEEEKKLSTQEKYEKLMSKTPDGIVFNAVRDMFADGGEVEAGEPKGGENADPDTSGDDVDSIKREAMDLAADPAKLANVLKSMVADYGRDFVVGAVALAGPLIDAKAEGYVNDVNGSLEGLISDVQAAFSGLHKSSIADAHEDFEEVIDSEAFQSWLDGLDEAAKAKAEQVIEGGSAGQVVKMLGQFKDSLKAAEAPKEPTPEDIWAEDAATAVRGSAPVKLPTRAPASDDDEYKRAWAEA